MTRHETFEHLAREVRRMFHQLAATAEELHGGEDGIGVPHRAVMESLWHDGDQTVPALARARSVSRQHIQVLVNTLLEHDFVEMLPNPAHQRSPLIRLTPAGRARFAAMRERERLAFQATKLPVTAEEMNAATEVLEKLRVAVHAMLENGHSEVCRE
jgi:DNA-binding MarR family transcriptional regulator